MPEQPRLGFVTWMKQNRGGEQRLGLRFFTDQMKIVQASIESGSEAMNEKRSWPLLIIPGKGSLTAYFPESRIYRNMIFSINSAEERIHFKVLEVTESGPNYSRCEIARARIN